MTRRVKVGVIQLPYIGYNPKIDLKSMAPSEIIGLNVNIACKFLDDAGREKVDIVCLPELFQIHGIQIDRKNAKEIAETIPGLIFRCVSDKAREYDMYVIAPILGLSNGILRNTAMLINRKGELLGEYHKVHLTQGEKDWGIIAGNDYLVFMTDFGKIGVMTCADSAFPEHARILSLDGAEIIFFPHLQSHPGFAMSEVGWEIHYRSRAIDNGIYLASSSYGVEEMTPTSSNPYPWKPGMMLGRSSIIGPDGTIIADMGRGIGLASATIDLDNPSIEALRRNLIKGRRPETYKRLCER